MVADAPTSPPLLPSDLALPVGSEGRGVGSCDTPTQATPLADGRSAATPKPLPEGGVGVGSCDTSIRETGGGAHSSRAHVFPTSEIENPTSDISAPPSPDSLFTLLLLNNLNVEATATQTNIPLAQLLDLLATEQSQKRLATYQQFQLAQVNTRILATTAESRLNAIKQLEELNKSSSNPIEHRRACSLILRYSTPLSLVARPSGPGLFRALKPLPEGGVGVGLLTTGNQPAGGRASAHPHESASSSPIPVPPPRSLLADIVAEVLASEPTQHPTSEIANPTSELSASPDSSTPLLPHSSTSHKTPDSLVTSLTRTLTRKHANRDERAAALLTYFTPTATINCKPHADYLDPFLARPLDIQRRTLETGDLIHHERLVLIRQRQPCLIARLQLKRENPSAPWLIAEAMTLTNTS